MKVYCQLRIFVQDVINEDMEARVEKNIQDLTELEKSHP